MILGLFQTDEAVMHQLQVFTKRICQSILDTKLHIHTTCIFSHICHFRPMTRPNPLKTNFRPIPDPTQPNPTQPAGQPNPWTTLCQPVDINVSHGTTSTFNSAAHHVTDLHQSQSTILQWSYDIVCIIITVVPVSEWKRFFQMTSRGTEAALVRLISGIEPAGCASTCPPENM